MALLEKNRGLQTIAIDHGFNTKPLFEIIDSLEQNSTIRSLTLGTKFETFSAST